MTVKKLSDPMKATLRAAFVNNGVVVTGTKVNTIVALIDRGLVTTQITLTDGSKGNILTPEGWTFTDAMLNEENGVSPDTANTFTVIDEIPTDVDIIDDPAATFADTDEYAEMVNEPSIHTFPHHTVTWRSQSDRKARRQRRKAARRARKITRKAGK